MNRGFASVVAVPAWAEFMKTGDREGRARLVPAARGRREGHDLPAERTARHRRVPPGWMVPGLRPGGSDGAAGRSRRRRRRRHVGRAARSGPPAAAPRSTVYDDYFPIGTAPTERVRGPRRREPDGRQHRGYAGVERAASAARRAGSSPRRIPSSPAPPRQRRISRRSRLDGRAGLGREAADSSQRRGPTRGANRSVARAVRRSPARLAAGHQ